MISALLCYLVSIVYYMLQCSMTYYTVCSILHCFNISFANKNSIDFQQFSYQYQNIILIIVIYCLISLQSIKVLLKINQYGTIAIVLFVLFIIVNCISNIALHGSIHDIE